LALVVQCHLATEDVFLASDGHPGLAMQAITMAVMGASFQVMTYYFQGVPVAKLPFMPPGWMARWFTHR